ncbi:MAG: hypothetical protein L6Q77_13080 [Bacteroidetes bacterium]|nr:hypothetical protein [Bacteroidota bacterium]
MNIQFKTRLICLFVASFTSPLYSQSGRIPGDSLLFEIRLKNGEMAKGQVVEQLSGPRAVFKSTDGRLYVISKNNTEDFELDREKLAELNRKYGEVKDEPVQEEGIQEFPVVQHPVGNGDTVILNSETDPEAKEDWFSMFKNPYWGFGFRYKTISSGPLYLYTYDSFGTRIPLQVIDLSTAKFSTEFIFGSDFPVTGFVYFDYAGSSDESYYSQKSSSFFENNPDSLVNSAYIWNKDLKDEETWNVGLGARIQYPVEIGTHLAKPRFALFFGKKMTTFKEKESTFNPYQNPNSGYSNNNDEALSDLNSPWHFGMEISAEYYFTKGLSLVANIQFIKTWAEAEFKSTQWSRSNLWDSNSQSYRYLRYEYQTISKMSYTNWASQSMIGLNFYF